ncbi:MAG: hypothetical protein AB7P20_21255 [Rhizobiaceae bacterium]
MRHDLAFDGGSEFAIYGTPLARDALLLRAGFELKFDDAVSVSADYSGALSNGTQAHSITGRVGVHF